jgi:DNA-binding NarL/FixJ family response regulator
VTGAADGLGNAGADLAGGPDPAGAQAPASPSVLLVDDQALVRSGLRMILTGGRLRVVGEAADGAQAVSAVRRLRPDIVLMDIRMPVMDGLEATRRILGSGADPLPKIIMLTTFDLDRYVYAALTAGASGFLLKDVSPEQLIASVRLVDTGDALLAPTITRRLVERFARTAEPKAVHRNLSELTPRELEILSLLGKGLSNAELAARLKVTEATVKSHIARVFAKLGLRDRAQAVVLAYETGLVTPGGAAT